MLPSKHKIKYIGAAITERNETKRFLNKVNLRLIDNKHKDLNKLVYETDRKKISS